MTRDILDRADDWTAAEIEAAPGAALAMMRALQSEIRRLRRELERLPNGRIEHVPGDRAIWQSENAKTYRCSVCQRPVFTNYEGQDVPVILCIGSGGHDLVWPQR